MTLKTRERILNEASLLFAEDGLGAFSMRRLARRVNLTATAIYRHFNSKEALISAVCVEGFRIFASYLWRALEEPEALARMNRTRFEYLNFAREQAHYYRTIFMTQLTATGWEKMPVENEGRFHATFTFLVDRVRECQNAGLLQEGDEASLAAQIWTHGHGIVSLRLAGHLSTLTEEVFESFYVTSCAAQLRGLRP